MVSIQSSINSISIYIIQKVNIKYLKLNTNFYWFFFSESKQSATSALMGGSLQSSTNCTEQYTDLVPTPETTTSNIPNNNAYVDKEVTTPVSNENNVVTVNTEEEELDSSSSVIDNDESCTNVELNNATNINIKNGSVINSTNMTNLNTAINGSNANNAINESIASNSSQNNQNALMTQSSNRTWGSNYSVQPSVPQELALNLHRHSSVSIKLIQNNEGYFMSFYKLFYSTLHKNNI